MRKIMKSDVEAALLTFVGQPAYIHSEVTSYAFVRNFRVDVTDARIAGDGPYRAAIRFDGHGWLRMEGLTEYEIDAEGRLLLAGHDERGRLYVALQLSRAPFPA